MLNFVGMKITVITATYNSEATVANTIDSLLSQTFTNVEHLIIDGASTDGTLAVFERYRPLYEKHGIELRIFSEPDAGIYDAMNKGLARATGDVVGLLNSDDFFESNKVLAAVADAFAEGGDALDAVYGDVHYVDPKNISRVVRRYSSASFRREKMRMGFMPAHPSFYCRRSLYDKFGNFDISFKVASDFEQLLRMIYVGGINTRYIPLTFVMMRTGGISSSGFRSHRRIYADHRKAYRKNGVSSNFFLECYRYICKIRELIST